MFLLEKLVLGKSLVIDSISAVTGSRVSKEIIRTGCDEAQIEAYFCENGTDYVLSREILQNGKNICKINGRLVTVSELKELGKNLLDIYGQHDNQSLLDTKTHLELLDSFAGKKLSNLKTSYEVMLLDYKEICQKLKSSFGDDQERARRLDLLNYQITEIESANIKPNEEDELLSRKKIITNSEKIVGAINSSYEVLDESVIDNLSHIIKELSYISQIDSKYDSLQKEVSEAYYNLQDAKETISEYKDEVYFDENELNNIEERLEVISNIKRKYGNTIEEINKYKDRIIEEKDFLENSEEAIKKIKSKKAECESSLNRLANDMSEIRKDCAIKIEKLINAQMQELEMKKAYLKFDFQKSAEFLETGVDEVELQICTNVGDELKSLAKIASGGELSRVMLAIKAVLSDYDSLQTMIFDEIDTGMSGETGCTVAKKLKSISKKHQIICVTHLPSIVAYGDTNYTIDKVVKNGKTVARIKKLDEEETIYEIARVIAGKAITQSVLLHARELRV
jgi:DNA repair protein RecN (Recombination protein N)